MPAVVGVAGCGSVYVPPLLPLLCLDISAAVSRSLLGPAGDDFLFR